MPNLILTGNKWRVTTTHLFFDFVPKKDAPIPTVLKLEDLIVAVKQDELNCDVIDRKENKNLSALFKSTDKVYKDRVVNKLQKILEKISKQKDPTYPLVSIYQDTEGRLMEVVPSFEE